MADRIDYNDDPVFYCKNCLSLRIKGIDSIDDSDYCDSCGSGDIEQSSFEEWDKKYFDRYGHHYLEEYK